ncbi:MAG TPA: alpha/beta hydrolase [bacterium]|jgi:pimeloyl-ACP methyl ester carboxylesterase|nr:alpha/beta hydrolase [bacterium]
MVRRILFGLLALVFVLGGATYVWYRIELAAAFRQARSASKIVETPCGQIEYATAGEGPPVLILHGTGGGWDQGLFWGRPLTSYGFKVIAPSRFGYLRTPFPADASPEAEADAWACFLDALGIKRLPVMGGSAGAPPALNLGLRHPDRVSAVVLLVPGLYSPKTEEPAAAPVPAVIMNLVLRFDFPMWAATKVVPERLQTILFATPRELVRSLSAREKAKMDEGMRMLLPITLRRAGLMNDARTQSTLRPYPLDKVKVRTLLVSAADDLFKTLRNARYTAQRIPGAQLIEYPTGGHFLLGHDDDLWPRMARFLGWSGETVSQP